jgi:hypothetical protein
LLTALGAIGLAIAASIGGWLLRGPGPAPKLIRFSIPVTGNVNGLDVSSDGARGRLIERSGSWMA